MHGTEAIFISVFVTSPQQLQFWELKCWLEVGERGTKHNTPHRNVDVRGEKKKKKKEEKKKKIGNQPPPPESSLCSCVPGVLLALQMVTTGPICVKVSQWQLQLRMCVMGSDLSPQGPALLGEQDRGRGVLQPGGFLCYKQKQCSAVFSYPSAVRKHSATLVCRLLQAAPKTAAAPWCALAISPSKLLIPPTMPCCSQAPSLYF